MLRGDLATTSLLEVLGRLASDGLTGALVLARTVDGPGPRRDEEGRIYLRSGAPYAVVGPTTGPLLGTRMVSSAALAPESLADALEAQRTELQGWALGELLVHLGYVEEPVVAAFLREALLDTVATLSTWRTGTWKFRRNERAREAATQPFAIPDLLAALAERLDAWRDRLAVAGGPDAIPSLAASGSGGGAVNVDSDGWALLCKVDGQRSAAELAEACGFTEFEAAGVVADLVAAGLVEVDVDAVEVSAQLARLAPVAEPAPEPEPEPDPVEAPAGPAIAPQRAARRSKSGRSSIAAEVLHEPAAAAVVAAPAARRSSEGYSVAQATLLPPDLAGLGPIVAAEWIAPVEDEADPMVMSLARVSQALSSVMGMPAPAPRRSPGHGRAEPASRELTPAEARRERQRKAAAAELAAAHAAAETERLAKEAQDQDEAPVAPVLDIAIARRESARRANEEARHVEETRLLTEAAKAAEEARRAEAAQVAQEARQAEQARLAQETELAEQARLAEDSRRTEAANLEAAALAEAAEQAEVALAAEVARQAEAARIAEDERLGEEARLAVAAKLAEAERLVEEARAAQAANLAAEALLIEEARLAEARTAEAAALAEVARLAAESRLAEAAALTEAAQQAEADRIAAAVHDGEESANLAAAIRGMASGRARTVASDEPAPEIAQAHRAEPEVPEIAGMLRPVHHRGESDTASLLRELSSLGVDEDSPAPPPARTSAPRPPTGSAAAKGKRKGLFSR